MAGIEVVKNSVNKVAKAAPFTPNIGINKFNIIFINKTHNWMYNRYFLCSTICQIVQTVPCDAKTTHHTSMVAIYLYKFIAINYIKYKFTKKKPNTYVKDTAQNAKPKKLNNERM